MRLLANRREYPLPPLPHYLVRHRHAALCCVCFVIKQKFVRFQRQTGKSLLFRLLLTLLPAIIQLALESGSC